MIRSPGPKPGSGSQIPDHPPNDPPPLRFPLSPIAEPPIYPTGLTTTPPLLPNHSFPDAQPSPVRDAGGGGVEERPLLEHRGALPGETLLLPLPLDSL